LDIVTSTLIQRAWESKVNLFISLAEIREAQKETLTWEGERQNGWTW